MKRLIINESQEKLLISEFIFENKTYSVDTGKVLVLKKFLDHNFKRASMSQINDNGMPVNTPIVGMIDSNGNVIKNMTDRQLFDLMQDKFKNLYDNNIQRDKFIAQVIKDWYYNKIDNNGLLSVNLY